METNTLVRELGVLIYSAVESHLEALSKGETVLEIEARAGKIIDKELQKRIYLSVLTKTVLDPEHGDWYFFDPRLPAADHKEYNELLNKMAVDPKRKEKKVHYVHKKEKDTLFEAEHGKVRVTTDQKTGKELQIIKKTRLVVVDIYLPRSETDVRLSVHLETKCSPTEKLGKMVLERAKDRLCYTTGSFHIDLTQTTQTSRTGSREIQNELEAEWADPAIGEYLVETKNSNNQRFIGELTAFLDGVFRLLRKTPL